MPVFSYELLLYPRRGSQAAETRDTVLRDQSLAYAVHERYNDNEHYDNEQLAPAAVFFIFVKFYLFSLFPCISHLLIRM